MHRTSTAELGQDHGPDLLPARLEHCRHEPCVCIVAPSGAGKSTLLRRLSRTIDNAQVVTLGRESRDPAALDSMIGAVLSSDAPTIAVDDVQIVAGTRGEKTLERVVARCDADHHVVLASRLPLPDAMVHGDFEPDLVTAPDLVLRIDEVADTFRAVGGHTLPLECASHVVTETCGWAALVHDLAVRSRLVEAESLAAAVDAMLRSDFATTRLEHALRALPDEIVQCLERTSGLASLDFAECAHLLGADAAAAMLDVVDSGAVMHVNELGSRILPPVMRRHLRARAGLDSVTRIHVAAPAAKPPDSPTSTTFDAAMTRLRRGDAVGAVPLLQRTLRTTADAQVHQMARLALLVIREPITPRETTLDALAALERECVALGLEAPARIVRGGIAAASDLADRAVAGVLAECEERDDAAGAALVAGIDLLMRMRRGHAAARRARALADRLERLGLADVAAWAHATSALLAAAAGAADAQRQITEAETAAIATGVEATRALLDAARALAGPAARMPGLMSSARRLALQAGLPRLPSSLPRPRATGREAVTSSNVEVRHPHLTVRCFGGFHLCADGTDIELKVVRPQARALLRMLALNAGAPLHRELIADILWGDLGIDSAVHALHVSVSSLRRALPDELTGPAASIVERVGEAYRLGIADRHDCDLADFDDQLAEAAAAKLRRDAVTTANDLRGALALYVGDVLPEDGPAEWVAGARERYRVRAAEAASSLAHLELRFGDGHAAVAAASRAVEIDPWLDESWRTLVMVHRTSGDVVAAQRAEAGYREMRVALGVE